MRLRVTYADGKLAVTNAATGEAVEGISAVRAYLSADGRVILSFKVEDNLDVDLITDGTQQDTGRKKPQCL